MAEEKYMIKKYENLYPKGFKKILDLNLIDFDIWFIMESDFASKVELGLKTRYPERNLIPFAKKSDCDDLACFEFNKEKPIQIIHDFASNGWEQRKELDTIWEWLEIAIEDLIEFNKTESS
ncbi:hypothetical protein [Vagococcus fluvialis]|jgi:hypothetical protein|uniref:hypothetical protein n=1 Tax=Vagococcus fluvialis TaxID=2738 RepID=UPI003B59F214